MAKFRKATPEELEAIKASVNAAVRELMRISWNTHKPKRGKLHIPDESRLPDNATCRRFLLDEGIRKSVIDALARGDGHFLVRFGDMLQKMFVFIEDTKYPLAPVLPAFLVSHWAEPKDDLPELFYLKPSDLAAVCIEHLGDDSIEEEQLVKIRQRLRLKPFRYKLEANYVGGKISFPKVDN